MLGPANYQMYNRMEYVGFVAAYEVLCNVRFGPQKQLLTRCQFDVPRRIPLDNLSGVDRFNSFTSSACAMRVPSQRRLIRYRAGTQQATAAV